MAPITGKTVIVTGSNRGIGLEFVRQLLAKQNRVIAACRTPAAAAELQKLGPHTILQLDVSDQASVEAFAANVKQEVQHVDVLINNAGVYGEGSQRFRDVTRGQLVDVFNTNTLGPLFTTQALYNVGLLGGSKPSLVANMTSKMGSIDDNGSGGTYAYRASKCALNIVNKSMALDLAKDGITVSLLHPGWVKTDMTDNSGLIDTQTCVSGLLSVLERSHQDVHGRWFDFAGKEIPW